MLTDYALAVLCLWFAAALWRRSKLWVTAIAAHLGGTAHGFQVPLGDQWQRVWNLTVWSIAIGSALLIASGVRSLVPGHPERRAACPGKGVRWLRWAVAVSLVALLVLVAKFSLHRYVNQNDIYHVIQMDGLYCLYQGALNLTAATP